VNEFKISMAMSSCVFSGPFSSLYITTLSLPKIRALVHQLLYHVLLIKALSAWVDGYSISEKKCSTEAKDKVIFVSNFK
jgi:hypothetical protein